MATFQMVELLLKEVFWWWTTLWQQMWLLFSLRRKYEGKTSSFPFPAYLKAVLFQVFIPSSVGCTPRSYLCGYKLTEKWCNLRLECFYVTLEIENRSQSICFHWLCAAGIIRLSAMAIHRVSMAVHQFTEMEKLIVLESLQSFGVTQPGGEN